MLQTEEIDEEYLNKFCRACWNLHSFTKPSAAFGNDDIAFNIIKFCCPSAKATSYCDIPLCESCVNKIKKFKNFWLTCYNTDVLYSLYKNKLSNMNDDSSEESNKEGIVIQIEEKFIEEGEMDFKEEETGIDGEETVIDGEETVIEEIFIINECESEEDNKCKVCLMECNSPADLMDHSREYNHIIKNNSIKEYDGKTYKILKCLYCPKRKFRFVSDYQRHLLCHTKENASQIFVCDVCGKEFTQAAFLRRHSSVHQLEKPYPCNMCEKEFSQKRLLDNHKKFVHNNECITCDICKGSYQSLHYFKKHLKERHKVVSNKPICTLEIPLYGCDEYKIGNVYKCPECEEEFDFGLTFQRHTSMYNEEEPIVDHFFKEEIVVCANSIKQEEVEKDKVVKNRKRKLSNQCDICDTVYETQEELSEHIKEYNHIAYNNRFREPNGSKSGYKIFKCLYCDRTKFGDKTKFKRHLQSHTGERSNICDICGKSFNSITDLKRHHFLHSSEKPFNCDICGKGYPQKAQLTQHVASVHVGFKFTCESCGELFSSIISLNKHTKMKHPSDSNQYSCSWKPDIKNLKYSDYKVGNVYVCPECDEQFANCAAFRAHAQNAGSIIHLCKFCDKKFHALSGLIKHYEKVHDYVKTNRIVQKCEYCNQKYNTLGGLRNHIAKKHPNKIDDEENKVLT